MRDAEGLDTYKRKDSEVDKWRNEENVKRFLRDTNQQTRDGWSDEWIWLPIKNGGG